MEPTHGNICLARISTMQSSFSEDDVRNALQLMRSSHIGEGKSNLLSEKGSVEDTVEPGIVHGGLKPISMSKLGDLQKTAVNHFTANKNMESLKGGKNVGKPRPVFTELIAQITEEEKLRKEAKRKAKKEKIMMDAQKRIDAIRELEVERQAKAMREASRKKKSDEGHDENEEEDDNDSEIDGNTDEEKTVKPGVDLPQPEELELPKIVPPPAGAESATLKFRKLGEVREAKLQKARKNREELSMKKEQDTLDKIRAKENKILQKKMAAEMQGVRLAWLTVIARATRISSLTEIVKRIRQKQAKWKTASQEKKAVRIIEIWWPDRLILLKIHRNRDILRPLLSQAIRFMYKLKTRKCRASAALVVQFIQDTTGMGETVKKVYAFRTKIVTLQRHARTKFRIHQSRLAMMMLMLEQKEEAAMVRLSKMDDAAQRKAR